MTSEIMNSQDDLRHVVKCPDCGGALIRVPALKCSRCELVHPLRAFTYRSGHHHIAECIDLDLLAQGATAEEAIGKLQEAMFSYLEVAFSGPTKGLVLRPSPLSNRLRYHAHRLAAALARPRQRHFVLPQPDFRGSLSHC